MYRFLAGDAIVIKASRLRCFTKTFLTRDSFVKHSDVYFYNAYRRIYIYIYISTLSILKYVRNRGFRNVTVSVGVTTLSRLKKSAFNRNYDPLTFIRNDINRYTNTNGFMQWRH